jgi:hypothetical protein
MMAYTCDPIYFGGGDQEDLSSKVSPGKKFVKPIHLYQLAERGSPHL